MTESPAAPEAALEPPNSTPELRTFLIADIRGYTRFTQEHGDEAAAQLVAKFAGVLGQIVRERGGAMIELRGDEALAAFSSARQALRAAVDLQSRFAQETERDPELPLPVGIGIDAGEAIPFEGGFRGGVLNLAARLCNLAGPGEILASEGVVYLGRQVRGISYTPRGIVPLKGFVEPVRVIRVMAAPEGSDQVRGADPLAASSIEAGLPIGGFLGALPSGVLVGRDEEWDRVMASLQAVMQGSGRLVLLLGEPGIGKTRIAQEVTLKARHWGFLVATGRCYDQEQAVPFYPFLEALAGFFEVCSASTRADIAARWPQLGRLLPEQIGPVNALASGPLEDEDQYQLFRAVTGMLQTIAESQPVALLLDDLHWADDSSVKLLQHLARYTRGDRILLLGTYRDVDIHRQHPLEAMLLDLSREQLVEEVEIRRLDREGAADLIAEVLGDRESLCDLVDIVYRRTEGNAFFIQEVLQALIERGDVYQIDGHWERRKIKDLEVPKSIRSVIGQRLSRLEEPAQEILREASVLGQTFGFDDLVALAQLAPRPRFEDRDVSTGWLEDEIDGALEQAVVIGLIRETDSDHYAFNHALTQQALYAELSTRRRKRLHLAAGQALARLPERVRVRRAPELAWHFLEGDAAEQALPYALMAGDQAEEVFAHGDAQRQYETALELARELEDRPREMEALEKLGNVLTTMARYDRALTLFDHAAAFHREAGDREGEACVVAQIGHVYYLLDNPREGIARLEPLAESLEHDLNGGNPSYGLSAVWAALARLYGDVGRPEDELRAADRSVELIRAIPDSRAPRLLLGAEVTRADALWNLGHRDEALRLLEDLVQRAEAIGDLNNLARALANTAIYYARQGDIERDNLYHRRALEVSERQGDRGLIVLWSMELHTNAFRLGNWVEAGSYLERAEEIVHPLGNNRLGVWPLAARGWLSLREGDLEAARTHGEEALHLTESLGDSPWRRLIYRLLAERDLQNGDPDAARQRLESLLDSPGWKRDAGFLRSLAMVYLEIGEVDTAVDYATRSLEQVPEFSRGELVDSLVVQGTAFSWRNRWDEAEADFHEALALSRTHTYPYGEARALYEYGVMLGRKGDPDGALYHLDQALAIFQRLGARLDALRAEQSLSLIDRA